MRKIKEPSLYLVITEEYGKGRGVCEIAEAAIKGGVDMIQMREKNKPRAELIDLGKKLSRLCKDREVIFIVNDDPELAEKTGADGVHLGQEDRLRWPVNKARGILGDDKIIGVSTHSMDQFKEASGEGFDYIAFGPIFETKTKNYFLGTKDIKEVAALAKKPVFFIGGINLSNTGEVIKAGASNIALIRGIAEADDISSRAAEFKIILGTRPNSHPRGGNPVIRINGKDETIDKAVNLMELVLAKGLMPERIVVEHNFRIVSKDEWQGIVLKEDDNVEIASFVGGG